MFGPFLLLAARGGRFRIGCDRSTLVTVSTGTTHAEDYSFPAEQVVVVPVSATIVPRRPNNREPIKGFWSASGALGRDGMCNLALR